MLTGRASVSEQLSAWLFGLEVGVAFSSEGIHFQETPSRRQDAVQHENVADLKRWFREKGHALIDHKVLREAFRHAWREMSPPSPGASKHRASRHRFWDGAVWEVV
eukprot:7101147-Pyramimonas_sp.AAC.1